MKKVYLMFFGMVLFVCTTNAQLVVFSDDYAAGVTFTAFGGSVNSLAIDPTEHHSGTASLKIPVTTGYTGGTLIADAPKNLSGYNTLTFWAKNDKPYFLDGAGFGIDATDTYKVERNGLTVTSTWTKFFIPIPDASKLTAADGLFHFAEGSGEGAYNIWIDDIQYENIGFGVVSLSSASFATQTQEKEVGQNFGAEGTTSVFKVSGVDVQLNTAKVYFNWTSSNPAIATFDALGVGTALAVGTTNVTGKLGSVNATGVLTVNVSAPVSPTIAAPTPSRNAAGVISLFSNAYTNNPVDTWRTDWSSGFNELTDLKIAGNDTKKYQLHHFAGVEFYGSPVNATNMDYIHIDVWTPSVNTFTLRLVDFTGPNTESEISRTPAVNTWVGYDIKLSEFASLGSRSKLSQMLFLVPPGTSGTYFIDNVYFYNSALPISFTDFKVTRKNNTALLQWNTAFELNNKGFSVERSSDAVNFKQISFINASDAASGAHAYTATDLIPVKGVNYYRIKQVDFDGHVTYSATQSLSFEGTGTTKLALFPNPAKDKVAITLGGIESSAARYYIVGADGKVVRTGSFDKSLGNSVQTLDVSNLARGIYMVKLTDGTKQQSAKLILN
ncbi:MAG TPA: T9SS type A sorting domain-containing protein [Panacibacter sp.]|nr:T9SS type A sorting domain-containing protein [Panacibacter sp.]